MKKALIEIDPLGEPPAPETGSRERKFTDKALEMKSESALVCTLEIWIEHEAQEIIIAQLRSYIAMWHKCADRSLCGGRRLSQISQAGKSATMKHLRRVLAMLRATRGISHNHYQVVIVTLRKRLTLKQLYSEILKAMGDPHYDQTNVGISTLLRRIEEHSVRLGIELLVIDEAQHLDNATKDAAEILDQMKTFVDQALCPIVFVGDEDSLGFFERNGKLAARLGEPLELPAMDPLCNDRRGEADALAFKQFCHRYDKALVDVGAISRLAGLHKSALLNGLLLVSQGHIGRIARLLQIAVPHAVWRGAETVEAFDLSHATRVYAMKNQWIDFDPFSLNRR